MQYLRANEESDTLARGYMSKRAAVEALCNIYRGMPPAEPARRQEERRRTELEASPRRLFLLKG